MSERVHYEKISCWEAHAWNGHWPISMADDAWLSYISRLRTTGIRNASSHSKAFSSNDLAATKHSDHTSRFPYVTSSMHDSDSAGLQLAFAARN